MSEKNWLSTVRFGTDGLVPVVAQESRSGDVLMVAFANREALERTATTGRAHYYSRSPAALWRKGASSVMPEWSHPSPERATRARKRTSD